MPRRSGSSAQKKGETTTRRSSRSISKGDNVSPAVVEGGRSRRSSTAAQTAASVADAHRTRSKNQIPQEVVGRRSRGLSGGGDVLESPASRVKSTRRSSSRINYEESEGEDDISPKQKLDEDDYYIDEDVENDSDSVESGKGRSRARSSPRNRTKVRARGPLSSKKRGKGRTQKTDSRRKRAALKDDGLEDEEQKMANEGNVAMSPWKPGRPRRETAEDQDAASGDSRRPRRSSRQLSQTEESPSRPVRSTRRSLTQNLTPELEVRQRPVRSTRGKPPKEIDEDEEDMEEEEEEEEEFIVSPTRGSKRKRNEARESLNNTSSPKKRKVEEVSDEKDAADHVADSVDTEKPLDQDKEMEKTKDSVDGTATEEVNNEEEEPMEVDASSQSESGDQLEEKSADDKGLESVTGDSPSVTKTKVDAEAMNKSPEPKAACDLFEAAKSAPKQSEQETSKPDTALEKKNDRSDPLLVVKEHEKIAVPTKEGKPDTVDSETPKETSSESKMHSCDSRIENANKESKASSQPTESLTPVKEVNAPTSAKTSVIVSSDKMDPNRPLMSIPIGDRSKSSDSSSIKFSAGAKIKAVGAGETSAQLKSDKPENDKALSESSSKESISHSDTPATPLNVPPAEPKEDTSTSATKEESKAADVVVNGTDCRVKETTCQDEPPSTIAETSDCDNASKANGPHTSLSVEGAEFKPFKRKYVYNPVITEEARTSLRNHTYGFVSCHLAKEDLAANREKFLCEIKHLNADVICLQEVQKHLLADMVAKSLDALGYKYVDSYPEDSSRAGLVTLYRTSAFKLMDHSSISVENVIRKDLETSTLSPEDKDAVRRFIPRCGHCQVTRFSTISSDRTVHVINVHLPRLETSAHSLQVSCLAREVVSAVSSAPAGSPHVMCGIFNATENQAPYQLLRDGYLSNEMIEDLQKRKDVVLPGKENAALVDLLWKSFQHPASSLQSCYCSVLGQEVQLPTEGESKAATSTSPYLMWLSSDSLTTVGVLDIAVPSSSSGELKDTPPSCSTALKVDVAFK